MSVETTIVNLLLNDTTVSDLVGTRIYPTAPRQDPTLPYIEYKIDETEATVHNSGTAALKKYSVLLDYWGKTQTQTKAIQEAIKTLCTDYRSGNMQRLQFSTLVDVDKENDRYQGSQVYFANFVG